MLFQLGRHAVELFAVFDWARIYLALQDYKLQRSWSNLRLDLQKLIDFCTDSSEWYTLYIPKSELAIGNFAAVKKQEDIHQFIRS